MSLTCLATNESMHPEAAERLAILAKTAVRAGAFLATLRPVVALPSGRFIRSDVVTRLFPVESESPKSQSTEDTDDLSTEDSSEETESETEHVWIVAYLPHYKQ
jgi:hypothetical protein